MGASTRLPEEKELQPRQLGPGGRGSQDPVPAMGAGGHLDPALELGLQDEQGLRALARQLAEWPGPTSSWKEKGALEEQMQGPVPAAQRGKRGEGK